jgi:hypothetical protein
VRFRRQYQLCALEPAVFEANAEAAASPFDSFGALVPIY